MSGRAGRQTAFSSQQMVSGGRGEGVAFEPPAQLGFGDARRLRAEFGVGGGERRRRLGIIERVERQAPESPELPEQRTELHRLGEGEPPIGSFERSGDIAEFVLRVGHDQENPSVVGDR